jgi:hypothetical protein
MDLPRGKFRSLQKSIQLRDILDRIKKTRFSGICTFSSGGGINGTLVFNSGTCVIANLQDRYGTAAWEGTQALLDQVFDIVLSDLDTTQLQLALDFNKKAKVQTGGSRQEAPPQKTDAADYLRAEPQSGAITGHTTAEKDLKRTTHVRFGQLGTVMPADQKTPVLRQAGKKEPVPEGLNVTASNGTSSAEKEFDTFDSMDLDDVAQKIRKDCKIILKQLQLDHLTEK